MKSRIRLLLTAACAVSLPALPAAGHERDEQPAGSAILHIQEHEDLGGYLVDQQQMALYLFDADMKGGEAAEAAGDHGDAHEDHDSCGHDLENAPDAPDGLEPGGKAVSEQGGEQEGHPEP